MTIEPILLDVDLSVEEYDLELDTGGSIDMEMGCSIVVNQIVGEEYEGPYEVTPTQSTQTLSTELKTCTQDIIINPIPSNYGLIAWNGSALTVS